MKTGCRCTLLSCILAAVLLMHGDVAAASDNQEARVTQIVRDVKLLPSKSATRPAAINDKVNNNTGVRTGDDSRSELTFVDLTITRLGANTIFSFNRAGRNIQLGGGSVLLRVPKDSGGARMSTSAVTVAMTGTTVILESRRAGRNKLMVLEGGARLSLNKHPNESATVRAGQMLDVPAGASKLPPPVDIDVDQVMKTNPLIAGFPPLPSRDLIYASAAQNSRIYQGRPVGAQPTSPGPPVSISIIPNIFGSGTVVTGTKHPGDSTRPGKMSDHPLTGTHGSPTPIPRRKRHGNY